MSANSSSLVSLGVLISATQASAISRRLWLGISVARPTAMPLAPLSSVKGRRAGNWLGETSLFDGLQRPHDVTALGPAEVLVVGPPAFDSLMASPAFARAMCVLLTSRVRLLYGLVEDTMLRAISTRVARRLLALARGDSAVLKDSRSVLPVSQEALAMMLGVTRQTLSKELKALVRDGVDIAYFPEGTRYGPQKSLSPASATLVLQFGGASGNGYPAFYTGRDMFNRDQEWHAQLRQIMCGAVEFPPDAWAHVSESARDLILSLLHPDPFQRLGVVGAGQRHDRTGGGHPLLGAGLRQRRQPEAAAVQGGRRGGGASLSRRGSQGSRQPGAARQEDGVSCAGGGALPPGRSAS